MIVREIGARDLLRGSLIDASHFDVLRRHRLDVLLR